MKPEDSFSWKELRKEKIMSDNKNNKLKKSENSQKDLSLLYDYSNDEKSKNRVTSISLQNKDEIMEGGRERSSGKSLFTKMFSKKDKEIVVVDRKRTKGYAPTVFAIILFSGLLFTNVLCQVKLDNVSNDIAAMTKEFQALEEKEKEYSYKLSQNDKEALENNSDYIENELGMVKEDPEKVYVDLPLQDEVYVVEEETKENGWTTLLSSVGRFFSDIFG
ncbi:MAG: hypothetical protein J6V36_00105 [Clostridia bacterium]|nr:hypothetical protein [Clostridia bacterium]